MESYYAHGKLLITGEYVVLNGAQSLAVPTQFGQYLTIEASPQEKSIHWNSVDHNNKTWFTAELDPNTLNIVESSHVPTAQRLSELLRLIRTVNSSFLTQPSRVITKLEFNKDFGLGTSSTLISLLAQAGGVDAYALNDQVFKSSGYDIACATALGPILYTKKNQKTEPIKISDVFKNNSFFVYLGKKQNSREAIKAYDSEKLNDKLLQEFNRISNDIARVDSFAELEHLLATHEEMIAGLINKEPVKQVLFSDYWSSVKSLGAWGGDFVLAISDQGWKKTESYFESKGFDIFYSYDQLILDESINFDADPDS